MRRGLAALAVLTLGGCHACEDLLRQHRAIDAAPRVSPSTGVVPPGLATAAVSMNTGGDQMSMTPVDVGIVLEVSIGDRTYRQSIASCRSAGRGGEQIDTLGFSTPAYVDSIACDERGIAVRAEASPARVEAFDVQSGKVLGVVPLPPGTRVVHGVSYRFDAPDGG